MQAVEIQNTQQVRSLEEKFEEKVKELEDTCQQVSYSLEYNDFKNIIGQLLQLQKVEDDLQAKDKQIAQLEATLDGRQTQPPCIQAEKQSSDATTQFIYSDVAECKSETFHVMILRHTYIYMYIYNMYVDGPIYRKCRWYIQHIHAHRGI